ncbi:MAG: hypothetical protein GEEBNDBF_01592 [bacterium]|nr:hypothetical protein [bacterium]
MTRLMPVLSTLTLAAVALLIAPSAEAGDTCTADKDTSAKAGSACTATLQAVPASRDLPNIVAVAQSAGSFSTLLAAAEAAGLVEALSGPGPITVFAPTDEAFAKLPAGTVEALLQDKAKLTSILTYHVVAGSMPAAKVVQQVNLPSLQGTDLLISKTANGVSIGGAGIVQTDIQASNGIIHVIDSVMLPPTQDIVATAIGAGDFSTLVAAVKAAGLVETLQGPGPFTVFAPTDAAFAKLPKGTVETLLQDIPTLTGILTYHVIPGSTYAGSLSNGLTATTVQGTDVTFDLTNGARINNAQIVVTDIQCTNGVIHVIDTVILPE